MALGHEAVAVGCWTYDDPPTGCTVVLPPAGTLGAVAVRGAAPGTREAVALGPNGKLTVCHAVVLAGGSAFGLAAADGVVAWLEERGVGYPVGQPEPVARVPIVGAAIVLDAAVAVPHARPGPDAGRAACEQATTADPPEGGVGVGAGCMVAKVGGLAHAWRGGQGIAVRRAGDVVVGALVANNAVGEVFDEDGKPVAASRAPHGTPRYPYDRDAIAGQRADAGGPTGSTVLGCVVTNARLLKSDACRVADLAHSGIARAVRPAHTQLDGDALFCLATGEVDATVDLLATLAAEAVADACRRGVRAAVSRHGVPGLAG